MTEKPPIVYIVDDDPAVRDALERLMRSVGIQAVSFASAAGFLGYEHPDGPACLILDVRMPGSSGLELQETMEATGLEWPIIFITGHGTIPMSVRAMKSGAEDFFTKPFDDQALLDAVQRALQRNTARRRARALVLKVQELVDSLTPREHDVFGRVVRGLTNRQVADELGTSEKTVKVQRARVMHKMGARTLADLVRQAEALRSGSPESLA
jgi:FixJ family two-component response regulator